MNIVWKKDRSVLEYAECDNDNSCIMNIAHSFDGKGMEITSELRLKNLTHVDIGSYKCILNNIYGATYSTKADMMVYVYPQFVLTPRDKTVQGGSSASLKCSATGKYLFILFFLLRGGGGRGLIYEGIVIHEGVIQIKVFNLI